VGLFGREGERGWRGRRWGGSRGGIRMLESVKVQAAAASVSLGSREPPPQTRRKSPIYRSREGLRRIRKDILT